MATLLTLPDELRDRIIEEVILHERKTPSDPASCQNERAQNLDFKYGQVRSWDKNVRYEKVSHISNAAGLLWTNRQLRQQTEAAIARLYPKGLQYKMDVMVVAEKEFWPTWLHIPAKAKQVQEVDVTFRVFGANTEHASMFVHGNASPPGMVWNFYYLLEHFLDYGIANPVALADKKGDMVLKGGKKVEMSAQNINIGFEIGDPGNISPHTDDARYEWDQRNNRMRMGHPRWDDTTKPWEHEITLATHPLWLAEFALVYLRSVLSVRNDYEQYGDILHERLGRSTVQAGGELLGQIDPGEILANRCVKPEVSTHSSEGNSYYTSDTFQYLPAECRVLSFWNWKYGAAKHRRARKLPLPDAVVWPTSKEMARWRKAVASCREYGSPQGLSSPCCPGHCFCTEHELEDWFRECQLTPGGKSSTIETAVDKKT